MKVEKRKIESINPLSPLQTAFLFHSLHPGGADPGQLKLRVDFRGNLNKPAFDTAWRWVVQHYSSLRTSVHWQNLDEPLQVVHRRVESPVIFEPPIEAESGLSEVDLEALLDKHRNRPLDISTAPVYRVSIISTKPCCHSMYWYCHHILLDGWSASIVVKHLLMKYQSIIDGTIFDPAPARAFRDYLTWLSRRDEHEARTFWTRELSNIPTDLSFWPAPGTSRSFEMVSKTVETGVSNMITQQIRNRRTTLALYMQAIWALMLSELKQSKDVVFGITLSGRSAPLAGIESMVGLFVNSVPLRADITNVSSFLVLLKKLQDRAVQRVNFEHTSINSLLNWGCLPGPQPFDSLLVVENFPWDDAQNNANDLQIISFEGEITAHYPLTLVVIPGRTIRLKLYFMTSLLNAAQAGALLENLESLLAGIAKNHERTIESLAFDTGPAGSVRFRAGNTRKFARHRFKKFVQTYDENRPPDSTLRSAIVSAWSKTLRIQEIDIHDNFFDLGGDSFMGLVLLEEINEITGTQFPITILFQYPTPAKLTEFLEKGYGTLPGTHLIPAKPEGKRSPFFMVHGGNLIASILPQHLDQDQPLYILEDHRSWANINLDVTVEQLARDYISDLRSVQPQGPYLLGGYSMGSIIVLEMAQQLLAMGEQIAFLFLLDPAKWLESYSCTENYCSQQRTTEIDSDLVKDPANSLIVKLRKKWRHVKVTPPRQVSSYVLREISEFIVFQTRVLKAHTYDYLRRRTTDPFMLLRAKYYYNRGETIPVPLRRPYVAAAYRAALERYKFRRYAGKFFIFTRHRPQDKNMWDEIASENNSTIRFDASHRDFMSNSRVVHVWSDYFNKLLAQEVDMPTNKS